MIKVGMDLLLKWWCGGGAGSGDAVLVDQAAPPEAEYQCQINQKLGYFAKKIK